ncbi:MAG: glycosyltransferase [Prochloraceae cyanobacterium]|nr:glycosyltransferase [Prochloraceae cyanobacterium]
MTESNLDFISVIIPVYNDSKRLQICLEALENQTYPQDLYEIIVVDNNSEENIQATVACFSQVKLTSEKKRGSYAARNKGINLAAGKILAFTDSDCIPATNWLEMGIKRLKSASNCGLVGGKIEIFFKDPQNPTAAEIYDAATNLQQKKYIEEHKYGATANLFTWKKVLEDVGYFDSNLKSGGDGEWGLRVHDRGYLLVYGEDVCIAHPARYSLAELSKKVIRQTGGTYDKEKTQKRHKPKELFKSLLQLRPPVRSALRKASSNQILKNNRQKLQLFLAIVYLHYVKNLEKVRLSLGGKSQN